MRSKLIPARLVLATLWLSAAIIGCQTRPPSAAAPPVFRVATEQELAANEYRVAPPDKLTLLTPVANDPVATADISPGGFITVPGFGTFNVAGKTTREIAELINNAAADHAHAKPIDVRVDVYASRFYQVFGEARETGRLPFTGRETVLNAVANAGFTDREWPATVYLFRPASARQRSHTVTIDMRPVCTTGDFRSNYLIEEGDVLFVPPGPRIAWNPKLLHQILAW